LIEDCRPTPLPVRPLFFGPHLVSRGATWDQPVGAFGDQSNVYFTPLASAPSVAVCLFSKFSSPRCPCFRFENRFQSPWELFPLASRPFRSFLPKRLPPPMVSTELYPQRSCPPDRVDFDARSAPIRRFLITLPFDRFCFSFQYRSSRCSNRQLDPPHCYKSSPTLSLQLMSQFFHCNSSFILFPPKRPIKSATPLFVLYFPFPSLFSFFLHSALLLTQNPL